MSINSLGFTYQTQTNYLWEIDVSFGTTAMQLIDNFEQLLALIVAEGIAAQKCVGHGRKSDFRLR